MQLHIIPLTYLCRCKTKVHDATSLLFAFLLPNNKVILTNTKKKWLKLHQNHLCKHFRTTNSRFGDCEKRFANEADLSEHERAHTSDKPLSCSNRKKKEQRNFQVMSWNISRGVVSKLAQIKTVMEENDVGVTFLIEVDESSEILKKELKIPARNL